MSEVSLKIEKILGQAGDKSACGVFTNRISLADGSLAMIISCISVKDDAGDLAIFIKDIFEIITKKVEGVESGILEALKVSHDACRQYIETRNLDVAFVNALFYKNACYITRYKDRVKVWVYEPEKSEEIGFEYGSGPLKANQIYLVATEKFVDTFNIGEILQSAEVDLGEVIDGLATDISAVSDQGEIGAALVMVKADEVSIEQEENEQVANGSEGHVEIDQEKDQPAEGGGKFGNFRKTILGFLGKIDFRKALALRRNLLYLGLLILIVLGLSAFFKIRADHNREKLAEFNTHVASASAGYAEAVAIIDLNKIKAREILAKADSEIKAALALVPNDEKASQLASDISGKLKETESLASVSFSEIASFDNSLVSLSSLGKGQLAAVAKGQIYKVDIRSKSSEKINGIDGAKGAFVFDNSAFVLSAGKVFKVDLAGGKQEKIIEGQDGSDLAVFLGNVYIVSTSGIYKFVPIEKGYAPGVNYLEDAETFDTTSHLAIDGTVWVTKNNQIFKYLRGKKQEFSVSGMTASLGQLGKIYTTVDSDNLYVIDVANSALLVIGKDGVYKRAYQGAEFGKAAGLVVDEAGGKMYLAVDKKILGAGL